MKRLFFIFFFTLFLFSCKEKKEDITKYSKYLLVDKKGQEIFLPKNKLIVLNFLSYSCSSCMKELPVFQKVLKEKFYKDKFSFIGCVLDAEKNDLSKKDFPFYACHRANFVRFPVSGTPTTYIITSEGKKLVVIFGAVDEETLKKFLNLALKKVSSPKN